MRPMTPIRLTLMLTITCHALAACAGPVGKDEVETGSTLLEVRPANVTAPSGDRTVIYGGEDDPRLTFSAGFMKRVELGKIRPVSDLSWAPDSRSFYVNDSGNAAWSELRLWRVGGREVVEESATVRETAIADLARENRCGAPAPDEYSTRGLGWGSGGKTVYVLTAVRRVTNCTPDIRQEERVSLIDVETGQVVQSMTLGEAAREWPTLSAVLRQTP